MSLEDRECNECGASDWNEIEAATTQYPERRSRDSNKTTRRVFECRDCGSEGRKFEDGQSSNVQFSGALR